MQNLLALVIGLVIFVAVKFVELNFLAGERMPFLAMVALVVVLITIVVKFKKIVLFLSQKLGKEQ